MKSIFLRTLIASFIILSLSAGGTKLFGQVFYAGADFSYVNEMEDCGAVYYENGEARDPYELFKAYDGNMMRFRLWHTPSWYDTLNANQRYSDLADVKKSIARAKSADMEVLLDFHLSDTWADPSRQLAPKAWLPVVDELESLKDSLYNYLFSTLSELDRENLLPGFIQIGNETNKGILLSPEDNEVWTLDWPRNAALFNRAIDAVNDFERASGKDIQTVLHLAGPENADWLVKAFTDNGVQDFDIIGLSYYWAWHKPSDIADVGRVIEELQQAYPGKEVLVVETGYIWTNESNDNANNIISESHPSYQPVSPMQQRDWLVDLAKEIRASGGLGLLYWEPCWVSTGCFTQWGQGSHQEHAAFFDFDNNLLLPGGIEWMRQVNTTTSSGQLQKQDERFQISVDPLSNTVYIQREFPTSQTFSYTLTDSNGREVMSGVSNGDNVKLTLQNTAFGLYILQVRVENQILAAEKIILSAD
ncbi:MAG: glycosyl hydrolase 53 family protein [Bacteroidota bacterium]